MLTKNPNIRRVVEEVAHSMRQGTNIQVEVSKDLKSISFKTDPHGPTMILFVWGARIDE